MCSDSLGRPVPTSCRLSQTLPALIDSSHPLYALLDIHSLPSAPHTPTTLLSIASLMDRMHENPHPHPAAHTNAS